jgi:hypothetical protein
MRLADRLTAAVGGENDLNLVGAISSLVKVLGKAECFELLDDVRDACTEVARSRPSSMLSALPFTRLPYEHVWVEWQTGARIVREELDDPLKPQPDRVGCLLSCSGKDFNAGDMTWAWVHSEALVPAGEHQLMVSPYAIHFDWREDGDMTRTAIEAGEAIKKLPRGLLDKLRRAGLKPDGDELIEAARKWVTPLEKMSDLMKNERIFPHLSNDREEQIALTQLTRHAFPMASLHCMDLWVHLNRTLPEGAVEQLSRSWCRDIEGEYTFATSFMIMLNAKGATVQERDDFSRLNQRRVRNGKVLLREFAVTRLNLSKVKANRGLSVGGSREMSRRHLVRGHFKVRKSGIYWWSPFVRGGGDALLRERYVVAV